ncbi:iron ABC transporter [Methylobacterium sp. Leaf104]|uniref:Fe(3+)-hydroxamate ABC transporter permease FhuB n=1 Tax=Methylobacterium TaxID=407 RepID=UPI0006FF1FED|nr:Fe(3+)-hydroxamate ABC transporter permease FhuB [Methylobacterium sp. Leaf104]KQP33869.1 iron ABC transporter [Methylobacterium sp. Leaf104]MCI9879552.1 Fe(3+)-hydroxamate ABC transporter permease FhuB [Methylobacterium goesingense]
MAEARAIAGAPARRPSGTALLIGAVCLAAALLTLRSLTADLPLARALSALWTPDWTDIHQVILHESLAPRLATAWLAGAALALSGTVLQQVLRNPLASPSTLGISAGAQLALALASLFAPSLFANGREAVALAGAGLAALAVFALGRNRGFAPLGLLLAGLVVELACGAIQTLLVILHQERLFGLFVWGAGSLAMNDWSAPAYLAPRLAVAAGLVALMVRPLALLDLDETNARSLGLGLGPARLGALVIAVALAGFVVSGVGVIGFVGFAAPILVRLTGTRRLRDRLIAAPLLGGALLWLTDAVVLALGPLVSLPTGAFAALLGVPLLLWLLPRLRGVGSLHHATEATARAPRPWRRIAAWGALLALLSVGALVLGRQEGGWVVSLGDGFAEVMPWRWPRVVASLAAGATLALAGALVQRLTGNPLASPEVLGVSAGAAFGLIVVSLLVALPDRAMLLGAGGAGAVVSLLAILALGRRAALAPEQMLLAGIALTTGFGALLTILMISGDPAVVMLRAWTAGSTARVAPDDAVAALALLGIGAACLPPVVRWLDLMPLGDSTGQALGLSLGGSRLAILTLAALLTAAGTLVAGPLSFVGLVAPQVARLAGLARAAPHLAGSALAGALIMVAADFVGRMAFFPDQLPAGLVAALVGAPFMMWLLARR